MTMNHQLRERRSAVQQQEREHEEEDEPLMDEENPRQTQQQQQQQQQSELSSSLLFPSTQNHEWNAMITRDIQELTLFERREADQDIRGKNILAAAAPKSLTDITLNLMGKELAMIQLQHSTTSAAIASSQLFRLSSFRVAFVRAERMNAKKAASRFLRYVTTAEQLFGQVALTRPIRIDDLDQADEQTLRSGWIQVLLTRDKCGRRIVVLDDFGPSEFDIKNKMRIAFYLLQVTSIDDESQKQGIQLIIQIFDPSNSLLLNDDATREQLRMLLACSPVRFSAIHVCFPANATDATSAVEEVKFASANGDAEASCSTVEASPVDYFGPVAESISAVLGRDERVRTKFHAGSIIECHNRLSEYGIIPDIIPMTSTGRVKLKEHEKWILIQIARERATQEGKPFSIVECPTKKHILLVKGRHVTRHEGNLRLRHMLQERYEERNEASRAEKFAITSEVLNKLQEEGYKFLVKNNADCWIEPDRKTILDKIAIAFRTVPRLKPLEKKLPPSTR